MSFTPSHLFPGATALLKNGSPWATASFPPSATSQDHGILTFGGRSANGTTDYFEVQVYQDTSISKNCTGYAVFYLVGA